MADPVQSASPLDDYIKRYRDDWIKAGPPSPSITIAMVAEIERLRAALRELLAVVPVLPAAAASIVGMRERYAVAIEEARRAAR